MTTEGYRGLKVWQSAKALAVEIYQITSPEPLARDFALRGQLRRSAVSVPSNIAEGDERDTNKDAVRFFCMAKGSWAELRTQLEIACEAKLLDPKVHAKLDTTCGELGRRLGALIKARSTPST